LLMPEAFSPDTLRELGLDPGLGVRQLHEAGITGKRVGVAIIDQTLLVNHVEYADRLRLYEQINVGGEARRLLIPMDSRTTASPTGVIDYMFFRSGEWSWSIPYIAELQVRAASR
jgi:hypothetical protein